MQAIWVAIAITVAISIIGFAFAPNILHAMGAEPQTIEMGTTYARIDMGGSMVIMMLFLINGIFRGAGDASMAMKSLWLANICNIILCPLLIRGFGPIPAFGLTGAAMATTTGRGIGVCYQLYHLFNGKALIKIRRKHFKLDWPIIQVCREYCISGHFTIHHWFVQLDRARKIDCRNRAQRSIGRISNSDPHRNIFYSARVGHE
jgi:Na+-driven multidrug efflux pump